MLSWLLAVVALVVLVWAADLTVDAAGAVARRLGISTLVIGLTLTSIGTSLPEIATNLAAGWSSAGGTDASGLAVGNIVGSNLTQITLLLGVVGLVRPLSLERKRLYRDGGAMLAALLAMWLVCADGDASQVEGFVLVGLYAVYLVVVLVADRREGPDRRELEPHGAERPLWQELLRVALGLGLVVLSARLLVHSGVAIARDLGVGELTIGFLVGVGTSLPELTVALRALQRGASGMSIGNLVGSNITDPLLSFGLGATLHPVTVEASALRLDFPAWLVSTVVALVFLHADEDLHRKEAAVLVLLFALFAWLRLGST